MTYISPSKVFSHLDRLSAWQHGEKPAPVTVEIDLSNVCSLGCQSCHFSHTHVAGPWAVRDASKPVTYSDTGKFADPVVIQRALGEMTQAGVQGVVYSGGGEPTLHPQFTEITSYGAAVGLKQGLYTLGGHITPQTFVGMYPVLEWAVVSLDCIDGQTYAAEKGVSPARFDAACEGVRLLCGVVPTVGVSFLLHAQNYQHMGRMLTLSRALGATYTTFRPTIETSTTHPETCAVDRSWVTAALPDLERFARETDVECDPARFVEYRDWISRSYRTCYGIRMVTQITPDGRVWVCPNRRGIAGSELGNLTTESFTEIWARHPGHWTDFSGCRAMCRLHLLNKQLSPVFSDYAHEAFV